MESKQIQKAGDGSQQIQGGTVNIYGITEARAREIFSEMNAIARQSYTQEAYELAWKRVSMFEELLMQKVESQWIVRIFWRSILSISSYRSPKKSRSIRQRCGY